MSFQTAMQCLGAAGTSEPAETRTPPARRPEPERTCS